MSRESTSIRALEELRDKMRTARQKTRGRIASLGPYCATDHVFELINQVPLGPYYFALLHLVEIRIVGQPDWTYNEHIVNV